MLRFALGVGCFPGNPNPSMACGLQTWISCLQSMDWFAIADDHCYVCGFFIEFQTGQSNKQTNKQTNKSQVNTPAMIDGIRHWASWFNQCE